MDNTGHGDGCYTVRSMTPKITRLAFLVVLMSCALLFAAPIEYHPVIFIFAALVGHVGVVHWSRLDPMKLPGSDLLPIVG
jgi:hypothetical protein